MQNYIVKNGQKVVFQSERDPEREADRYLSDPSLKDCSLILLYGMTSFFFLSKLIKTIQKEKKKVRILAIDPDEQQIKILTNNPGSQYILKFPGLYFYQTDQTSKITARIEDIYYRERISPFRHKVIRNMNLCRHFQEKYMRADTAVSKCLKGIYNNILIMNRFRILWGSNLLRNIQRIKKEPDRCLTVKGLQNHFKNKPVLIICAGPSLDRHLSLIRRIARKYFLICVDTALRPLMLAGIRPDLIVGLDAQKENCLDFRGVPTEDLDLAMDITAHYRIPDLFKGRIHFFYTSKMITDPETDQQTEWAEPHYGLLQNYFSNSAGLQCGGSVSTTALDLALYGEAEKIIFIGQDLGFENQKIYCRGTYTDRVHTARTSRFSTYDSRVVRYMMAQKLTWKGEKNGRKTVSTFVLSGYAEWLKNAFTLLKDRAGIFDPLLPFQNTILEHELNSSEDLKKEKIPRMQFVPSESDQTLSIDRAMDYLDPDNTSRFRKALKFLTDQYRI